MFSNFWDKTKAFFTRSQVIFYSRLQALSGFVLAVAGSMDWSQIQSWDFTTPKQTAWLGIGLIINGVVTETLRRAGTVTTTSDQLVPTNLASHVDTK